MNHSQQIPYKSQLYFCVFFLEYISLILAKLHYLSLQSNVVSETGV